MTRNNPKLVYFNEWLEGQAVQILDEYADIDLVHLNFATEKKLIKARSKPLMVIR